MQTEVLIQELSAHILPVKRLASPAIRFLQWLGITLVITGISVALIGIRPDFSTSIREAEFLIPLLILVLLIVYAGYLSFASSVPGWKIPRPLRLLPFALLLAWAGFLGSEFIEIYRIYGFSRFTTNAGPCIRNVCLLSFLPGAILLYMIRQAAPLRKHWSGAFSFLTAAGLGALASQLTCFSECPFHLLIWHVVPVVGLTVAGALSGEQWFKK